MTKVNCLISGVTGMVGSHLVDFLIENTNWNIYGICRWRSPIENIESHINLINNGDRFSLHYCDIRDLEALQNIFKKYKFDYVFHLAAQSYPQTSFISPSDTYETNIIGTQNILNCIKSFSPKAVTHVCSSSEVFGRVSKEEVPINEKCRFHPASPYAISKCGTDLIGQYFAEAYNLNIQITRMFTHTGPRRGDVFAESSFAKQIAMIEQNLQQKKIYVGNLKSLRTFADVRDAVRAYYLLVTKKPKFGEIYNIVELGERIKDSYTNEYIGREQKEVGKLKIIDVGSKLSTGEIVSETYRLADEFELKKYIVKKIYEKKSKLEIAKEKINNKEGVSTDDDW